jgi:hypothetical protein
MREEYASPVRGTWLRPAIVSFMLAGTAICHERPIGQHFESLIRMPFLGRTVTS